MSRLIGAVRWKLPNVQTYLFRLPVSINLPLHWPCVAIMVMAVVVMSFLLPVSALHRTNTAIVSASPKIKINDAVSQIIRSSVDIESPLTLAAFVSLQKWMYYPHHYGFIFVVPNLLCLALKEHEATCGLNKELRWFIYQQPWSFPLITPLNYTANLVHNCHETAAHWNDILCIQSAWRHTWKWGFLASLIPS